jgi:hypothetical protein
MPNQQQIDEFDEILDWMCDVYQIGGEDLKSYKATLQNNQITSISDGKTTVNVSKQVKTDE